MVSAIGQNINANQAGYLIDLDISEITGVTTISGLGGTSDMQTTSLRTVILPDTVTKIDYSALACCDNLTELTIPASVTEIGQDAFAYCPALQSVTFAEATGWKFQPSSGGPASDIDVTDPQTNATNLKSTTGGVYGAWCSGTLNR